MDGVQRIAKLGEKPDFRLDTTHYFADYIAADSETKSVLKKRKKNAKSNRKMYEKITYLKFVFDRC